MRAFRTLAQAAGFGILALCISCGGGYYYGGVAVGPPAPLIETPYGVAPGPDYVWTPGFYEYGGGNWAWRHGEWRHRPHPVDRWAGPRYEQHGNGYRVHPGGWQHGNHFHH